MLQTSKHTKLQYEWRKSLLPAPFAFCFLVMPSVFGDGGVSR